MLDYIMKHRHSIIDKKFFKCVGNGHNMDKKKTLTLYKWMYYNTRDSTVVLFKFTKYIAYSFHFMLLD